MFWIKRLRSKDGRSYPRGVIRGFTLMEIVVALSILALGLAALFNFFPLGLSAIRYARVVNEIALLANRKLEEVKTSPDVVEPSGTTDNMNWTITKTPIDLEGNVTATLVELNVDCAFEGRRIEEKFVTYAE